MQTRDTTPEGLSYGQFSYLASIGFVTEQENNQEETNIEVEVSGYGSKSTALVPEKVYTLGGRFLALQDAPVIFFEQAQTVCIGEALRYGSNLNGKVSVWGYGVVVARQEVRPQNPGNYPQASLRVTLQHTDYHNTVGVSLRSCVAHITDNVDD